MTDLPARLEAATEGSRADSDLVLLALGFKRSRGGRGSTGYDIWHDHEGTRWKPAPDPARSVDDGLALLREMLSEWPEGHLSLSWPGRKDGILISIARATLQHSVSSGGGPAAVGSGSTLALALAAALVRAKEQETASE